jgi:hypothetical protein
MLVVNHGKPLCHHAIKPQFWRDFYHFIPISGDYLAVFSTFTTAIAAQEVSLFRGFTAMRLDSWPTIPARKMPYGVNGILVGGEKPPTHLKNHGVSNSWDVPFPTEWKKNSSKPPGCMMISGYLWHFGEHWANRSIPKNSRIFP